MMTYFAKEGHPQMVNEGITAKSTPSALQVADLYTRLSGLSPLLLEENIKLPGLDVFSKKTQMPVILELNNQGPIFQSHAKVLSSNSKGPKLSAVVEILKSKGIHPEGLSYQEYAESAKDKEINPVDWVAQHAEDRPVIILHHDHSATSSPVSVGRRGLGEENGGHVGNSTVTELTEFEISQYQICLWTAVGFVILVGAAVCSVAQMEVIPDSLLYAKFQSGRTGHRSD